MTGNAGARAAAGAPGVLCEIRDSLAIITLNRPAVLNALSLEMIDGLRSTLRDCAQNLKVRAVMIRGAGEKAFCAGGDIRALYQSVKSGGTLHHRFFPAEYPLDYLLYSYPKPYIALLDGITMGGGMGISQGSRLRVVSERTRIAMPEVGIGLFPDVGASYFLSRLPGALGIYLALTGLQIRAADAVYAGLADFYVPPESIQLIASSLESLNWTDDTHADVGRALSALATRDLPQAPLSALRLGVDAHFAEPSVPAILAALRQERRPEYAAWAQQTAALIMTRSPTMLSVTLRQLQRGRSMRLADCLRMELNMMQQCFVQGDFLEGVRAVIVDKDNSPHWNPSRLQDLGEDAIEAFFKDHWPHAAHPLANLERESL
jgi:enoyl-CoA hydratase/carnithine racemase